MHNVNKGQRALYRLNNFQFVSIQTQSLILRHVLIYSTALVDGGGWWYRYYRDTPGATSLSRVMSGPRR